jgi:hypothetical protein
MRTNTNISFLISFYVLQVCLGNSIAFADDLSDVASRVVSIQATDPSLPSGVTDPKWMIWTIISKVFLSSGKIKNAFVEWISGLTNNYVPRYNGTSLVNGSIYDNGTNIGIGTASPGTSKLNVQQTGANIAITAQTGWAQAIYATSSTHYGVHGVSTSNIGVVGQSTSGVWVYGQSPTAMGVQWSSTSAQGVYGSSTSHYGVQAYSTSNIGIVGQSWAVQWVYGSSGPGYWVQGDSTSAYGVYGTSGSSYGVYGYSTSAYWVYAQSAWNYGIVGRTTNASYGWVLGYSSDASVYGILGVWSFSLSWNGTSQVLKYKFNGVGGDSGASQDGYAVYQEAGAWSGTYPDLVINYTTGIKFGAYNGYGWVKFFNNAVWGGGTQIMSIGDGDNDVRLVWNLRAPFFYDSDNTGYYVDPNSISIFQDIRPSIIYDRDNTGYYVDPNGTSNTNYLYRTYGFNGAEYDANNSAYYVDPNNASVFQQINASIMYDRDNTAYYIDLNNASMFNQINSLGNHIINNTSPTIYFQDSDHRSAMIHNNSNQFYVLNGCWVNSTGWCINGSYWPMQIDLTTDQVTIWGNLWVAEGAGVKTTCVGNCF